MDLAGKLAIIVLAICALPAAWLRLTKMRDGFSQKRIEDEAEKIRNETLKRNLTDLVDESNRRYGSSSGPDGTNPKR